MTDGFALIGLQRPKNPLNVGGVLRAAGCYGAAGVVVGGAPRGWTRAPTDTECAWRSMPLTFADDLRTALPYDCVPVAVELLAGAKPLHTFHHPRRALYIFGPEDGALADDVTTWCRDVVYVPTRSCMNLAAAVNVLLYDRAVKRGQFPAGRRPAPSGLALPLPPRASGEDQGDPIAPRGPHVDKPPVGCGVGSPPAGGALLSDFDHLVIFTAWTLAGYSAFRAGAVALLLGCHGGRVAATLGMLLPWAVLRAPAPRVGWQLTPAGFEAAASYKGPSAEAYAPIERAHRDGQPVVIGSDTYYPEAQGRWDGPTGHVCSVALASAAAAARAGEV